MRSIRCWIVILTSVGMFGCNRTAQIPVPANKERVNVSTNEIISPPRQDEEERRLAIAAGLADGRKASEEAESGQARKEIPLPNFPSGPGAPRPLGRNFYEIESGHPTYLICSYDVSENTYDKSNELVWFGEALLQIRNVGKEGFPPFDWIAVVIVNRAEHSDENSFAQSFKAGAVFSAPNVFNREENLQKLVLQAQIDLHPFTFALNGHPQRRWPMVERHANSKLP